MGRNLRRGAKTRTSMATHVAHIPAETVVIRSEDHELLRAALKDWYDKVAFTDDHVIQVSFQRWLVETAWARTHNRLTCVFCLGQDPLPQNL